MDRPLKILTFLLWVFLLSQSHSLVESLLSDQPDRVSSPLKQHNKGTPSRPHGPNATHHGLPQPPPKPHPPPRPPPLPTKETRPQDQPRQSERTKNRKMNLGKEIGVLFLGIGVALQVVVVGVLGFKRRLIFKEMKERQWDFSA